MTTILLTVILAGSLLMGCGGNSSNATVSTESSYNTSASAPSASNNSSGGVAQDTYMKEEPVYEQAEVENEQGQTQTQNSDTLTLLEEKLVYHCDLDIETLDYPTTMTSIKETISKYNGVIQSENESDNGREWYYESYRKTSGTLHNYLQVRIPSEKYDDFLKELDGVGKIVSKSTSVDNISQEYYDTATQIEAFQIQERNLLDMLEKCETIEDMLTVQERLTQVQYELNRLQTNRRYMDMDVAYSYVNISISEVMEYRSEKEPIKTNTFVDRLQSTIKLTISDFRFFLEMLLFLLIRLLPYLMIAGIICFIFRKKIMRFRADRKAERAAHQARMRMRQTAMQSPVVQSPAIQNQTIPDATPKNFETHGDIVQNNEPHQN